MALREVYEKWTSINLVLRVLAGLLIGIVLALIVPNIDPLIMLGELFVEFVAHISQTSR